MRDVVGMLRGDESANRLRDAGIEELGNIAFQDIEHLGLSGTPLGDGIRALVRAVRYAWSSHDAAGEPDTLSVLAIIRAMSVDELWEDIAEAVKQRDHVELALYITVLMTHRDKDKP
jgi:hypothetical protein